MPERQLQAAVEELCLRLGLLYYHTHRSEHSAPGWPDMVICAPGRGVLFWELKRDEHRPTPSQQLWLAALESAGCQVAVRRPADLRDGTVAADLQALARQPLRPGVAELLHEVHAAGQKAAQARLLRRPPRLAGGPQ